MPECKLNSSLRSSPVCPLFILHYHFLLETHTASLNEPSFLLARKLFKPAAAATCFVTCDLCQASKDF